jgi:hypothetical protein
MNNRESEIAMPYPKAWSPRELTKRFPKGMGSLPECKIMAYRLVLKYQKKGGYL